MAIRARALAAEAVYAFATSAARDACNRGVFCDLLRERADLVLEICTGEEEARLSYLGAALPGRCGVIDVGGGSTEWAVGGDGVPLAAASLQMGCVRLQQRSPIDRAEDLSHAVATAEEALARGLPAMAAVPMPMNWVGVGGTLTALASLEKRLKIFDPSRVEGCALARPRVEHWACELSGMTLEDRRRLPGLWPERADIIAHGAAILLASMRLLRVDSVIVSHRDNLDGYLRRKVLRA
jgi:exopolyphosphatase/guanosine-5'-triphosphate,3'-diphosphate pyrophosphatase